MTPTNGKSREGDEQGDGDAASMEDQEAARDIVWGPDPVTDPVVKIPASDRSALFAAITQALTAARADERRRMFDFEAHLQRQREWSESTFGPGDRAKGVVDHIRKELLEIEAEPRSTEWIDVVILALDGLWRAGYSPNEIIAALVAKQAKNEDREWPDWRTQPTDKAIEHNQSPRA